MECRDFGHATTIPIYNWILKFFWWMGNSKGFPTSHHMQDSDTFCKSYDVFFFFLSNKGMLSATTIAAESAQNSPKLPNFVKIYPKTKIPPEIARGTLKYHLKLRFYFFSKKIKNPICRECTKACSYRLDFQYNNFLYAFFIIKNRPLYVNFSIPVCGKYFFSQCSTLPMGMRFCRHIPIHLESRI
jgi:hypothetical protein